MEDISPSGLLFELFSVHDLAEKYFVLNINL